MLDAASGMGGPRVQGAGRQLVPESVFAEAEPVWHAVARVLLDAGADTVFGLLGSGNFELAAAFDALGAEVVSARHEGAAIAMADGFARARGGVGVCTVHQGPGLTNLLTGLTEAAKSRTPLLLLVAETIDGDRRSNFHLDQAALVSATGAGVERVATGASAADDALRALDRAICEQRPIALMLPLDVQQQLAHPATGLRRGVVEPPAPSAQEVEELVALLLTARRPLILAGRGAVRAGARDALIELAKRSGALLATTTVANGLFDGLAHALGICGGFASPVAARLIVEADAIAAFGASLNPWTTGHGSLIGDRAAIAQVDVERSAIGAHLPVELGVLGDCRVVAEAALAQLSRAQPRTATWRNAGIAVEIAGGQWRRQQPEGSDAPDRVDPRTLAIALDAMLPDDRAIAVDSGHFVGWPSMYIGVRDPSAFIFPQAFQAVGLGLGAAIGAALARPERLTVGVVGDGGALMALGELETVARLDLPILIVVYNDAAYGAEVHCFAERGLPLDGLVRFGRCDFAAVARALGIEAVTVGCLSDLDALAEWLRNRRGPLLVDARVDPRVRAHWHEVAHGHDFAVARAAAQESDRQARG